MALESQTSSPFPPSPQIHHSLPHPTSLRVSMYSVQLLVVRWRRFLPVPLFPWSRFPLCHPRRFSLFRFASPLPSSASVPGGCPSGLVSLPAQADSCPRAGFPCLVESVLGADLGVVVGAGDGLPVGAQNVVRVGFRSSPVKDDAHCVDFVVNSLQGGPPDSLVHAFPSGFHLPTDSIEVIPAVLPTADFGKLEAHPNSIVEMLPPELSVVHVSLDSQLIRPIPSPISDASVETHPAAQIPVSGPPPGASSSPSWASVVGQQHNQGDGVSIL